MSSNWLLKEHKNNFISWFNERISNDESAFKTIKWMSYMPKFNVVTWTTNKINNFPFYTNSKYYRSTIQNSGVMVEAESMYFLIWKIRILYWHLKCILGSLRRFERLIRFCSKFLCKSVGNNIDVQTYELGYTQIHLGKTTYMTKPFIMDTQEKKVFYVTNLQTKDDQLFSKKNKLLIVMKTMISILIFLRLLLTQHKFLLHMKSLIGMMCMLFVMIMKKTFVKINK